MDRKLIDYLPDILKDIREYKQLNASLQVELEFIWSILEQYLENAFIKSQDERLAKRWEELLGLKAKDTDSLELRNLRILSSFNEQTPYTIRKLEKMLTALVGKSNNYELNLSNNRLDVKLALGSRELLGAVNKMLENVVPLNIALSTGLLYATQKGLNRYRHKDLKAFTHNNVKNLDLRS